MKDIKSQCKRHAAHHRTSRFTHGLALVSTLALLLGACGSDDGVAQGPSGGAAGASGTAGATGGHGIAGQGGSAGATGGSAGNSGGAGGQASGACAGVTCGGHGTCELGEAGAHCVCEDGFQADGLTCVASSTSKYLEPVTIPPYDAADPTHVLITETNGKWTKSTLNNVAYKHFYIAPGTYDPAIAIVTAGTKGDPRTISLYNGNNKHPAALPDSQVANAVIHFSAGAAYWTIDRLANLDRGINPSMSFRDGAGHIIVNRWHLRGFLYGAIIYEGCNYNTVQNSYIDQMTKQVEVFDSIGLDIQAKGDIAASIIGTKFINNDIRNATDAIQTTRMTDHGSNKVNFEGTIIDNNRLWIDKDVYNDSTGTYDPSGEYTIAENAIDLKAGSENSQNPMLITNNIMWGMRTNPGDPNHPTGTAFVSHFGVRNVKLSRNVVFDTGSAIAIMGSYDWTVSNNIFFDTNRVNPEDTPHMSMAYVSQNARVAFTNNSLIKNYLTSTGSGQALYVHQQAEDDIFAHNLFIDTQKTGGDFTGHVFDDNWFYHATETLPGTNAHHYDTVAEAKMTNLTFTYKRFTASPMHQTLHGVVSTKDSPHQGLAGSNITGKNAW